MKTSLKPLKWLILATLLLAGCGGAATPESGAVADSSQALQLPQCEKNGAMPMRPFRYQVRIRLQEGKTLLSIDGKDLQPDSLWHWVKNQVETSPEPEAFRADFGFYADRRLRLADVHAITEPFSLLGVRNFRFVVADGETESLQNDLRVPLGPAYDEWRKKRGGKLPALPPQTIDEMLEEKGIPPRIEGPDFVPTTAEKIRELKANNLLVDVHLAPGSIAIMENPVKDKAAAEQSLSTEKEARGRDCVFFLIADENLEFGEYLSFLCLFNKLRLAKYATFTAGEWAYLSGEP